MATTVQIAVKTLVLDEAVNIRADLDEVTVLRYMETYDQLPPVSVVIVDGEPILTDGFHRTEAAMRLGKRHIAANMKKGTMADAVESAAVANFAHGLPLEPEEVEEAVTRLSAIGLTQRDIAQLTGRSQSTVSAILNANKAMEAIEQTGLSRENLAAIGRAPVAVRAAVARAAEEQGWDKQQTRDVVNDLRKHPDMTVADVMEEAVPHIKAMKERLQYVRMFDQVIDTVKHLEAAGITPARVAASIDDPVVAERWRRSSDDVQAYIAEVFEGLQLGGKNIRVVK